MPSNPSGKWVSRAAATGGGRTYRGQVPANWYAALVLIVVLGVASFIWSRYEYRNAGAVSTTPPVVGTTWYAGYMVDICGKEQPSLASNASGQAFYTQGKGVITISPKTNAEAGTNAVLGRFVEGYKNLDLSETALRVPVASSTSSTHTESTITYHNGQRCGSGTPDAGQQGVVKVVYWPNLESKHGSTVTGDPAKLRFSANQRITIAFLPKDKAVPPPNGLVVTNLLDASSAS